MAGEMNLRIITKNHAADPEIGFLAKSIQKSNGCATAMPTAWELNEINKYFCFVQFLIGAKILKKLEKTFSILLFIYLFFA